MGNCGACNCRQKINETDGVKEQEEPQQLISKGNKSDELFADEINLNEFSEDNKVTTTEQQQQCSLTIKKELDLNENVVAVKEYKEKENVLSTFEYKETSDKVQNENKAPIQEEKESDSDNSIEQNEFFEDIQKENDQQAKDTKQDEEQKSNEEENQKEQSEQEQEDIKESVQQIREQHINELEENQVKENDIKQSTFDGNEKQENASQENDYQQNFYQEEQYLENVEELKEFQDQEQSKLMISQLRNQIYGKDDYHIMQDEVIYEGLLHKYKPGHQANKQMQ